MTVTMLDRPGPLVDDATRRQFLAGGAALAALLAGCSTDTSTPTATPDTREQPWRFTDDLGITVELEARPQRVVAQVRSSCP